eukprot:5438980-Amphidinium_carterae.1
MAGTYCNYGTCGFYNFGYKTVLPAKVLVEMPKSTRQEDRLQSQDHRLKSPGNRLQMQEVRLPEAAQMDQPTRTVSLRGVLRGVLRRVSRGQGVSKSKTKRTLQAEYFADLRVLEQMIQQVKAEST